MLKSSYDNMLTEMEIDVLIDEGVEGCPDEGWLRDVAEKVIVAESIANAELSLVITTQERVRELNRVYRGEDEPTDVLSFYMTSAVKDSTQNFVLPPDGVSHLGEVVISCPQAVIQAKECGHSIQREIAILIVHGVLHLLGYDHEKPYQKRKMRAREKKILESVLGI